VSPLPQLGDAAVDGVALGDACKVRHGDPLAKFGFQRGEDAVALALACARGGVFGLGHGLASLAACQSSLACAVE
jgi:hypothetical protein